MTAMVVFYALEHKGRWFVAGFAAACLAGSAYGFLQGAWPFGCVEIVWSAIALRRFWKAGRAPLANVASPREFEVGREAAQEEQEAVRR